MKVKSFEDLIVWQKSHQLTLSIYKSTSVFPDEEKFGIISQMRRAAYSVPSNIVEGHARESRKEFFNFLNIAYASLSELKYFILLAKDLNYLGENDYSDLSINADEVSKILFSFKTKVKDLI